MIKTKSITKIDHLQYDISEIVTEINHILGTHKPTQNQISLVYRDGFFDERWTDGAGSSMTFENSLPVCNDAGEPVRRFVETEFQYLNPEIENTVLGQIYQDLSKEYNLSRYRLAMIKPKTCYSWHYDEEIRIHIPVITNPGSFIITDDGYSTHLPADGSVYIFNAQNYHTAINADRQHSRWHLLVNII